MALSKDTVAKRLTAVPSDIDATLTAQPSEGKRDLFGYSADKYGTVRVRAYVPEGVSLKGLNGHVLTMNDDTLAEEADDNPRKREIVARAVIMLKGGKFLQYGNIGDDDFTNTVLVVVNIPNWASVETVTLKV